MEWFCVIIQVSAHNADSDSGSSNRDVKPTNSLPTDMFAGTFHLLRDFFHIYHLFQLNIIAGFIYAQKRDEACMYHKAGITNCKTN